MTRTVPTPALATWPSPPLGSWRRARRLAVVVVLLSGVSCSSEEQPDPGPVDLAPVFEPDDTVIRADDVQDVTQTGQAFAQSETTDAVAAPGELANIGSVDRFVTGGRDLFQLLSGRETTLVFDIDRDGELETLGLFIIDLDSTVFMSWTKDSSSFWFDEDTEDTRSCHLSWMEPTGVTWYALDACGGSSEGPIVCTYDTLDGAAACSQCPASGCRECAMVGSDIYCDPDYLEAGAEPDPEPDAGVDDVSTQDGGGPDESGGSRLAECDPACLDQAGAFCCFDCSCTDGEIPCIPQCTGDFTWDCELSCCWNVDRLECDCPEGTTWEAVQFCCWDGAGCL